MQVTFLGHSGFLVELPSAVLLFDWWKGELPALPKKPLLIFASHGHSDHFDHRIFSLDGSFILGYDIDHAAVPASANAIFMDGNRRQELLPGITVETLPSTDEGVAFLVTADGQTVLHAGDLNWWHWEGEPDPWNPDMEKKFKTCTEPLRGRRIDLAMLPLDPRQGEAGFRGAAYFLEIAKIRRFLPMHQWDDYAFTRKFLSACPGFAEGTVPVLRKGQHFSFDI